MGKAVLGLAKAFIERCPSYRAATIDRFPLYMYMYTSRLCVVGVPIGIILYVCS